MGCMKPAFVVIQSNSALVGQSSWCQRSSLSKRTQKMQTSKPTSKRQVITSEASITDVVRRALQNKFRGKNVERVSTSFENSISGNVYEVDKDTPAHQRAASYIEGLDSVPFYNDFDGNFGWVKHLETNWETIAEELSAVTSRKGIEEEGNNIWAPPVVEAANAYGPDWRTLVLKDRVWDPTNTKLFPNTTRILQDKAADVPAVEAFFARQAPKTGIKLHTDDCNFILTMHLGLHVPLEKSWIEVAGERRYWENGSAMVFNTSYFHQTMNESDDQDRLVLLIRFWHPQLTTVEREALSFLFDVIENPNSHPDMLEAEKQLSQHEKKGTKQKTRRSETAGRGFGG